MASAADPHRGSVGKYSALLLLKPFVEFDSIPSDISMRRPRHLQVSSFRQDCTARIRTREGFFDLHFRYSFTEGQESRAEAGGPAVVETINCTESEDFSR